MTSYNPVKGFGASQRFPAATGPASLAQTQLDAVPTGSPSDHGGQLLHPSNPLLAFGVIAAVTFGLMAFSTSVRVGKTRAGITIGET